MRLLFAACLALAGLTLLAPSSPSFDPFAWLVWGRQLAGGEPFGLAGGPSWKPLPVLFTAPFSLAGDAAPALWLLVARAGALLALAGAFALAARLAGRWAGAVAAVALLLLADFVALAWRGASEPLLLACVLWACERHLADSRRTAFALGVAAALIRPEVVPFLALYAALLWRGAAARERAVVAGGVALVPLLWLGVPALGGDALAASSTASSTAGVTSPWTALRRGVELPVALVWPLAVVAVASRVRDRAVVVLASATIAWLVLVVAMTAAGYAGVARYMLPAAALACVLAGVGVVALARARVVLVVLLAVVAALSVSRVAVLDDQVRDGMRVGRLHDQLVAAVDAAGGPAALRRCALGGWVAVNHTAQTALAWELRGPLDRVARTLSRPGLLVHARREPAVGAPPPIALANARRTRVARAGAWRIDAVGVPPPACRLAGVRPRAQNPSL